MLTSYINNDSWIFARFNAKIQSYHLKTKSICFFIFPIFSRQFLKKIIFLKKSSKCRIWSLIYGIALDGRTCGVDADRFCVFSFKMFFCLFYFLFTGLNLFFSSHWMQIFCDRMKSTVSSWFLLNTILVMSTFLSFVFLSHRCGFMCDIDFNWHSIRRWLPLFLFFSFVINL